VKQLGISSFRYGFATIKSKKTKFYVLENGEINTNLPAKVYPVKPVKDTLTYDRVRKYVGLTSKNIPVRYDEITQFQHNKSYVGKRFSKFTLQDYYSNVLLDSDTWLSAKILDENIVEISTVNGIKYYNLMLRKWL
jgi:hypothetical protein